MTYYERNLPHWQPPARKIFITWRLEGSLPSKVLQRLSLLHFEPGKQFLTADRCLDGARHGPLWLKDPAVAECVERALRRGADELRVFELNAYVILANHVHLLIAPAAPLARITKGIKGASAREANQILHRPGRSFWQDESFDHWIRTPAECERVRNYIHQNPVTAGLLTRPEDWRWSSAHR
jgi:REP element-mobilizing transposase RayT